MIIVGAGFTGLWTAYYLLRADPSLQVEVLEAQHVGFGASGRNGGWVSSLWPVPMSAMARRYGERAARDQAAALRDTVIEVGDVCAQEGIAADYHRGGVLVVARGPAQVARARAQVEAAAQCGEDTRWLEREEARARFDVVDADGATHNPHCARVHPGKLVRGLAEVVRRMGAAIHEGHRVERVEPGVAWVDGEPRRGRHIILATEAWTNRFPGRRRGIAPVYSLMVATEPLPDQVWARIGLADREVFSDHGHLVVYGQRTADGRIAFGGRGAPYHFGSRVRPSFDADQRVFRGLRRTLKSWLPVLGDVHFTHAWGGPLGISRDWHPQVSHDPNTRIGSAGGYVGDGVAATNLAGRTLADLVLGRDTDLTRLAWVGHQSPRWEPEPMRWLGINAGLQLASVADLEERITRRPARTGRLLDLLTGG